MTKNGGKWSQSLIRIMSLMILSQVLKTSIRKHAWSINPDKYSSQLIGFYVCSD